MGAHWLKLKEWTDKYGPIVQISLWGTHFIVGSEAIANDLLNKRGGNYSDRPRLPAAQQLLSGEMRITLMDNTDLWKENRKLIHQVTNLTVAPKYEPIQLLESAIAVRDLIRNPSNYEHVIEQFSAAIISKITYGKDIRRNGDKEDVRAAFERMETLERIVSTPYLVNFFPWLMKVPKALAPFKQQLGRLHDKEITLYRKLFHDVQSAVDAGHAAESQAKYVIDKRHDFKLNDDQVAYALGAIFEGGATTTSGQSMVFFHAMLLYPEWLRRIQAEIDAVCPDLPQFEDLPQLPALRAVIKECVRWRPLPAAGFPHAATKDDTYNGIFIPAGSVIHANHWAILRDPKLYPDADSFRPERWLEGSTAGTSWPTYKEPLTVYPNLVNFPAFGFGRRICPGQHIASRSIHILAARIVWACDIVKAKDTRGQEITPPVYDYEPDLASKPKPFPCDFKARIEKLERLEVALAKMELQE